MPSSVISKGSIWGTLGEESFMASWPSCPRDSWEGSERTDLNWSFSTVAFFLLSFSSFTFFLPGVSCFLCLMNLQNPLLLSCTTSSSVGDMCMYDQYACRICLCTNPFVLVVLGCSAEFTFWIASFVFLSASLVYLLPMAICLLFWLFSWEYTHLGLFLVLSLDHSTCCLEISTECEGTNESLTADMLT